MKKNMITAMKTRFIIVIIVATLLSSCSYDCYKGYNHKFGEHTPTYYVP